MDAYLNEVVRYLFAQSWQIALLTAAVAVLTFALRGRSAHVRYLLWMIVLAKCLVPPLHAVPLRVLPEDVPGMFPSVLSPSISGHEPLALPGPAASDVPNPQRPQATPSHAVPPDDGHRLSVFGWLGIAWVLGAGTYLMLNLLRALRGHYWLHTTRRPLPEDLQVDTANLLRAYGVRRLPQIWMMEGVGQPFVWGLLCGSIYVPPGFLRIEDPEHRRDILAHELSHVLRLDAAVNTLQIIAQGLFWFHPFVWWANCQIRREREKCCDEMAIARLNAKPKDYSTALVSTLIQAQESTHTVPSLAVAGPVKNLEERIRAMLKPGKRFYKRPSLIAASTILIAALLTVPTALVLTARAELEPHKPLVQSMPPLHEAAAAGDVEKVKTLLSKGANVNAISFNAFTPTPLHCAAASGNKETVELLLSKGADRDPKTRRDGRTPVFAAMLSPTPGRGEVVQTLAAKGATVPALHLGAYVGDMGRLEKCLEDGTDVNSQEIACCTALHVSASAGRKNVVEFLISKGASVDARDSRGLTALYYAAMHKHEDVVDLLLAKGADINARNKNYGNFTLLNDALYEYDKGALEFLIRKGANVNVKDDGGYTPLVYGIWQNDRELVELLIRSGADVNVEDNDGHTPYYWAAMDADKEIVELLAAKGATQISTIHLAARAGNLATVKSLIEADVDVNARDKGGETPLLSAVQADSIDVAEFLIARGAAVNAKDNAGTTALNLVMRSHGRKDMVELLIAKGADVNTKTNVGVTPLHSACLRDRIDAVHLLIAKGASLNERITGGPAIGATALHFAAGSGRIEIVTLLIDRGADIDAKASNGHTPLHSACLSGRRDVVELLIAKGVDMSIKDNEGQTALSVAEKQGHKEVAEFLLKHGAKE